MKTVKRVYRRWFVKMARIKQAEANAYIVNFNKEYTK
jgi:hypothetical protein